MLPSPLPNIIDSLLLSKHNITIDDILYLRSVYVIVEAQLNTTSLQQYSDYRQLIIDIFPNIWILDGIFVTKYERERVKLFYETKGFGSLTMKPSIHSQIQKKINKTSHVREWNSNQKSDLETLFFQVFSKPTDKCKDAEKMKFILLLYAFKQGYIIKQEVKSMNSKQLCQLIPMYNTLLQHSHFKYLLIWFHFSNLNIPTKSLHPLLLKLVSQNETLYLMILQLPHYIKFIFLFEYLYHSKYENELNNNFTTILQYFNLVKQFDCLEYCQHETLFQTLLNSDKFISYQDGDLYIHNAMGSRHSSSSNSNSTTNSRPQSRQSMLSKQSTKTVTKTVSKIQRNYKEEDPNSIFYYPAIRIPKSGEKVMIQGQLITIFKTIHADLIVLDLKSSNGNYFAIKSNHVIWNSNKKYWSYKHSNYQHELSSPQQQQQQHQIEIFSNEGEWLSQFLIASKQFVEEQITLKDKYYSLTSQVAVELYEKMGLPLVLEREEVKVEPNTTVQQQQDSVFLTEVRDESIQQQQQQIVESSLPSINQSVKQPMIAQRNLKQGNPLRTSSNDWTPVYEKNRFLLSLGQHPFVTRQQSHPKYQEYLQRRRNQTSQQLQQQQQQHRTITWKQFQQHVSCFQVTRPP